MVIVVVLIAAGIFALAHTAPFPFLLDIGKSSEWRMPETPGRRVIYLTFDDGPNPAATPRLLDVLQRERVHATFFLIDDHVTPQTAPLVRRMFAEGHGVALHSGNRWMMLHSPARIARELDAAADRIEQLAGSRPCPAFRPHAGWRSLPMLSGVRRAGYTITGWSWRTFDWVGFRKRTAERVAKQIADHAASGKIVVMHDGHHVDHAPDRQYTIGAVQQIIPKLREQGYEFGSLCEAIAASHTH